MADTYSFRTLVKSFLILFSLADALCVSLVIGGSSEGGAAVDAGEGRIAHRPVFVEFRLFYNLCAS